MSNKIVMLVVCTLGIYLCLSANVASGTITCYNCTSPPNSTQCFDPIGNVSTTECPDNNECVIYTYDSENTSSITRECAEITNDTCSTLNSTRGNDLSSCKTCRTNNCNSALSFEISLVALLLGIFATKVLQ